MKKNLGYGISGQLKLLKELDDLNFEISEVNLSKLPISSYEEGVYEFLNEKGILFEGSKLIPSELTLIKGRSQLNSKTGMLDPSKEGIMIKVLLLKEGYSLFIPENEKKVCHFVINAIGLDSDALMKSNYFTWKVKKNNFVSFNQLNEGSLKELLLLLGFEEDFLNAEYKDILRETKTDISMAMHKQNKNPIIGNQKGFRNGRR